MKYAEIQELYDYCIKEGIDATIEKCWDGYAIRFPNGSDIVQHSGSYGGCWECVEPAIGCRLDYRAVPLKNAKALVKYHKDRLNKKRDYDNSPDPLWCEDCQHFKNADMGGEGYCDKVEGETWYGNPICHSYTPKGATDEE